MPEVHTISRCAGEPNLSVIFVHGTDGNYIRTWGPPDQAHNWIYWIGVDQPHTDVFSVQHEGSIWSLTDYATITEYAEAIAYALCKMVRSDRILFIGHSLGGIIVKQIAIAIETDYRFEALKGKSLDYCFIATPHLGGNFNFVGSLIRLMPNKLMGLVFGWNLEVQEVNDRYLGILKGTSGSILCFAERRRLFGIKLMPESSAFIQDEKATNLAVSRDHKSISKLKSKSDVIYISIIELCKYVAMRSGVGEEYFELDEALVDRIFRE